MADAATTCPGNSGAAAPIRVVVVDDQAMIRLGLRMILDNEPDIEVVGEAGDGRAGAAMARALRPDVVLMDIRMPRMDGIEAAAKSHVRSILTKLGLANRVQLVIRAYEAGLARPGDGA